MLRLDTPISLVNSILRKTQRESTSRLGNRSRPTVEVLETRIVPSLSPGSLDDLFNPQGDDPDSSRFGPQIGLVTTDFGGVRDRANGMVIDPEGE